MKLISFFVVLPGFEPREKRPKPVVVPLHHRTILIVLSFEEWRKDYLCKGSIIMRKKQIFSLFLVLGSPGVQCGL